MIFFLATAGFLTGIVLDLTVFRTKILHLFKLSMPVLILIEFFYSIMTYGFFMGFPVFNSFVGIAGGYIVARQCMIARKPRVDTTKSLKQITVLSFTILSALCVSTALLALREETICSQVKGMLQLNFDVTMAMIWGLILTGTAALLIFQYGVSKLVIKRLLKKDFSRITTNI